MFRNGMFVTCAVFLTFISCCDPAAPEKKGVEFKAQAVNLSSVLEDEPRSRIFSDRVLEGQNNLALSPSVYKIALVNFWLIKDDKTEVNLINPEASDPVYTETNPLIIDFTSEDPRKLLSLDTLSAGTYTGYKMQFLYLEMKLPVAFHLPGIAAESDLTDIVLRDHLDLRLSRNFRLYFNATGKYWKKDFVVKLLKNADRWFWLRREIEDQEGGRNFFISVNNNDHPQGGAGPDNTIDLFSDEDFWGDEEDLGSPLNPIIVGTDSEFGGLDVFLDEPFTIPQAIEKLYTILMTVDVKDTMNFGPPSSPASELEMKDGLLNLGPGFNSEDYGNIGLHPMVPKFSIKVETK